MSDRFQRVAEIFSAASMHAPDDRSAYLDRVCGDDPELRSEIESLMGLAADLLGRAPGDADPGSTSPETSPEAGPGADGGSASILAAEPPALAAGRPTRIGPYRVKRLIASGGMGTVYEAVQERPRRTVALKVMKQGISSRKALRRFEYEAQILGRLRHPCVAAVYEAGTHEAGGESIPYFAMEYIASARSITEYVRSRELSVRERLRLFARVCDAVAHGHQKGIIHRDLKPSNIVVDASGAPKVIDFGVARATDSDMAVTTLQTDVGQLIGTLQYMSPEQCEADPNDIDSRSDVYALGVVFYEMLCGQLPYDLANLAIPEAARVIREHTPVRPSTMNRSLRGDVETIALKALEKDRARRYRSAAELGEDVERFLRDEPILARRPSLAYQVRVLVRRNRVAVGLVAFAAVALLLAQIGGMLASVIALGLGLLGTSVGFVLASRAAAQTSMQRDEAVRARQEAEAERNRALGAEQQAETDRAEAEEARRRAEIETRKSVAINQFLLQDMLGSADPVETRGRDMKVSEVLENASRQIDRAFRQQPEIASAVHDTIGTVYRSLGRLDEAERHLRAALTLRCELFEGDDADRATSLNNLARLLYERGALDEAEPMFREALAIRRRVAGPGHPAVAVVLLNLSSLLRGRGKFEEATSRCMEALEINQKAHGHDHAAIATNLIKLARLWEVRDDHTSAEELFRRALRMQRKVLGDDHLHVGVTLNNLGNLLHRQGRYAEAEPVLREAMDVLRKRLGGRHRNVAAVRNNLARMLMTWGNYAAAARVYEELLDAVDGDDAALSLSSVRSRYEECLSRLQGDGLEGESSASGA